MSLGRIKFKFTTCLVMRKPYRILYCNPSLLLFRLYSWCRIITKLSIHNSLLSISCIFVSLSGYDLQYSANTSCAHYNCCMCVHKILICIQGQTISAFGDQGQSQWIRDCPWHLDVKMIHCFTAIIYVVAKTDLGATTNHAHNLTLSTKHHTNTYSVTVVCFIFPVSSSPSSLQ